jgi:transposase
MPCASNRPGSYGTALARVFADACEAVVGVNQPHRHTRARRGNSDPIYAEAAARKVPSGEASGIAKHTAGVVAAIWVPRVASEGAIEARTVALARPRDLLVTAPSPLSQKLAVRKTLAG